MCALSAPIPSGHIRVDDDGVAWIEGTRYRVTQIVLELQVHGWSPEEIHFQHYRQLGLAQIHAALSYYYDHQEEIDARIAAETERVHQWRREAGETPFEKRMRAEGNRK